MLGRWRFALAPRWLGLHLLVIAMAVAMVLLGRWQLDVSNAKQFSLQNFGYALQWWAFTAFALYLWRRLLLDAANARREEPTAMPGAGSADLDSSSPDTSPSADTSPPYRRYVMPRVEDSPPVVDDVHAAYNAYLAGLSGQPTAHMAADEPSNAQPNRGNAGQSAR